VNSDPAVPQVAFESAMADQFGRIAEYAERYFGARISAALSTPTQGASGFPAAVANCRNLVKDAFFLRERTLLLQSQEYGKTKGKGEMPTWDLHELQNLLDQFQIAEAGDFIARSIDTCFGRKDLEPYSVREKLHDLYRVIKQDSLGKGIVLENIVDGNGLSLYQAILRYDLLSDISDSFAWSMHRYGEECGKIGGRRLKKEIARIIAYVNSNLGKELTVANIAGVANMSESYFSHLFKTEMGVSFVDYLNRLRIGKAKELLLHTDLRINEIAFQVGIGNPNYFSILFRKLEGRSPVEFRSSHLPG